MAADPTKVLAPFIRHGLAPKGAGKQRKADCPFCGKQGHFYISSVNGMWDCKRCHLEGNVYTYLKEWHSCWLSATEDDHYEQLSELRDGLPIDALRHAEVAYVEPDEWIIPIRNEKGTVVQLRTWQPKRSKKLYNTEGLPAQLWNLDRLTEAGPVYICEGEWDGIAWDWLRRNQNKPGTVLAVPGANVWRDWENLFSGRQVFFLYDHQDVAYTAMDKHAARCATKGASPKLIRWPSGRPEGYDIRDWVCGNLKKKRAAWNDIIGLCRTFDSGAAAAEAVAGEGRTVSDYGKVIKEYRELLFLTPTMEASLVIMFATILACQLKSSPPIWMYVVGPPGSGKTEALLSCASSPWCHFESYLTPTSLISGFIPSSGEDLSLIKRLIDCCLVVKDNTRLMGASIQEQEGVYSTLRDFFDGYTTKPFGHMADGGKRYEGTCSMLIGTVPQIHEDTAAAQRASLGERFLKVDWIDPIDHDRISHTRAALRNEAADVQAEKKLRGIATAFLNRKIDKAALPKPDSSTINQIIYLAECAAQLRTHVHRSRWGGISHDVIPEISARLAKQLLRLSRMIAVVRSRKEIDNLVMGYTRKVVRDTIGSQTTRIIDSLKTLNPGKGRGQFLHPEAIRELSKTPLKTLRRRLDDLTHLRVAESGTVPTSDRGRPAEGYRLLPSFLDHWKKAGL